MQVLELRKSSIKLDIPNSGKIQEMVRDRDFWEYVSQYKGMSVDLLLTYDKSEDSWNIRSDMKIAGSKLSDRGRFNIKKAYMSRTYKDQALYIMEQIEHVLPASENISITTKEKIPVWKISHWIHGINRK